MRKSFVRKMAPLLLFLGIVNPLPGRMTWAHSADGAEPDKYAWLEDIYGENKAKFLVETRNKIQSQIAPVGVQIQQFGFIGKPRFTAAIEQAITQKTQAITDAERARNQLAVTQAEVAKTVAEAEGEARSAIERARGEAEANRLRQASITPQLLEWKRLENQRAFVDRWNGELPHTVLGDKNGLIMPLPTETR